MTAKLKSLEHLVIAPAVDVFYLLVILFLARLRCFKRPKLAKLLLDTILKLLDDKSK